MAVDRKRQCNRKLRNGFRRISRHTKHRNAKFICLFQIYIIKPGTAKQHQSDIYCSKLLQYRRAQIRVYKCTDCVTALREGYSLRRDINFVVDDLDVREMGEFFLEGFHVVGCCIVK